MKLSNFTLLTLIIILIIIAWSIVTSMQEKQQFSIKSLLTDPFLQLPTSTSVNVVWFTEFEGERHWVTHGRQLKNQTVATTTKLSRIREDEDSAIEDNIYTKPSLRNIWRHEAVVTGLTRDRTIPYQVSSEITGAIINSSIFSLSSLPSSRTPLKILLTSDHQLMPMTAANLQKVTETINKIDGVFFAGDLVNIPDRASEWFDDNLGGAFFPCLQGRASYELDTNGNKTLYRGGEIIQNAPLFTAIGNHEVMGRFSLEKTLKQQFSDAVPRSVAAAYYKETNPDFGDRQIPPNWLKDNSFNTQTYEEIFSLPQNNLDNDNYYAVTFGNIRLVVLYATNIWRNPSLELGVKGRYREREDKLNQPWQWGYGQHIFEPIAKDSSQYRWLEAELNGEAFQQAKYKIVMFHHPPHTLGGNIVPAYTNPQAQIKYGEDSKVTSVRYQYPIAEDYIIRDLIPLLETAGVQLVYYGHSHLWNRFISPSGMHFLESSNVGNTYGAHLGENKRSVPEDDPEFSYATIGDPNGLEPIVPSIAPLIDELGNPLPYVASNEITVFSIFDTATGTISSYRYNTRQPNSAVVKFDEFVLNR